LLVIHGLFTEKRGADVNRQSTLFPTDVVSKQAVYAPVNNAKIEIYTGDCSSIMKKLDAASIQCCVTSPPYYGLRDYGTASWVGGDPECEHKEFLGGHGDKSKKQITSAGTQKYNYKHMCKKCGAKRTDDQIGLEQTPDEYIEKLVAVFREVHRVLKDDGVLWINIGDSYNGSGPSGGPGKQYTNKGSQKTTKKNIKNLKTKDLIGIPWMLAFALRADGWYLRQDIIWAKNNPMPESVQDRCTKSHEYIFLLSKNGKYFYDYDAIKEKQNSTSGALNRSVGMKSGADGNKNDGGRSGIASTGYRNKRSVWTVNTKSFPEAHFATFPEKLIEPCIKAGSRMGDTVLDPFFGSGTTGVVAKQLNRNCIGIELNPEYVELAQNRINSV